MSMYRMEFGIPLIPATIVVATIYALNLKHHIFRSFALLHENEE